MSPAVGAVCKNERQELIGAVPVALRVLAKIPPVIQAESGVLPGPISICAQVQLQAKQVAGRYLLVGRDRNRYQTGLRRSRSGRYTAGKRWVRLLVGREFRRGLKWRVRYTHRWNWPGPSRAATCRAPAHRTVVYRTAPSGRLRSLIKQAFEQTAKDLRNSRIPT